MLRAPRARRARDPPEQEKYLRDVLSVVHPVVGVAHDARAGWIYVFTAIEPISAHSREGGNPGAENSAKELGPRFRARACTHLKSGTTGLSAPLPPRALASGGEGSGWGGGRLRYTAAPPTRHVAFGAAPPSPPLRGGRNGARGIVSALHKDVGMR